MLPDGTNGSYNGGNNLSCRWFRWLGLLLECEDYIVCAIKLNSLFDYKILHFALGIYGILGSVAIKKSNLSSMPEKPIGFHGVRF